jgi:tetraacyldisaccharide 4'-kinase
MAMQILWYKKYPVLWPLIPFSWIFSAIVSLRRFCYNIGLLSQQYFDVPVIVVGNLTVGGTGKTPLVIHIANLLKQRGKIPGIISRGYKGKAKGPVCVTEFSDPRMVGDEAVLLAKKLHCPVVVGANRPDALRLLLKTFPIDVVIADDGLQHYALYRHIEIAVVDGVRRFGNGFCLPTGPLREPKKRLRSVDFIINNGGIPENNEYDMEMLPLALYNLLEPDQKRALNTLEGKRVHAVAGIGHPERFFQLLRSYHIQVIPHSFPDHTFFKPTDIQFSDELPVIMTEKDAVKCAAFASSKHWVLTMKMRVNPLFDARLLNLLQEI